MQYVNLTEHTLRFKIDGKAYEVEPMTTEGTGECDVPDGFVYAVKGMGLPLTPKADVEPASPTKTPAPAAPVASAPPSETPTASSAEQASPSEARRKGR